MASIIIKESFDKIINRFNLVLLAAKRAKDLSKGSPVMVEKKFKKNTSVALQELNEDKLNIKELYNNLILSYRKNVEYTELEENKEDLELIEKEIMGEQILETESDVDTSNNEE